jgi:GxxExxY protein
MNKNLLHSDITALILKAFFKVYNTLGYGFLEKVYENAMVIELRKMGVEVEAQYPILVYYFEDKVGHYSADLFVSQKVIVELKASSTLHPEHEAQLINYLKGTNVEVGMLLNFGPKPDYKRKVFSNEYKNNSSVP